MNQSIYEYIKNISFTNDLKIDVLNLLNSYGFYDVCHHCSNVAEEAVKLAVEFGEDVEKARKAGLLHDISVIIPNDKRIDYAG